ncbi:MAG: alpha-amylase family glycosyl hydrolase, partial [Variovorax sp.]
LDFVPNHTSDEHPWFVQSKSSTSDPKRDWFLWRDPAPDRGPPNNWLSNFGGPAWTLDEKTGQYYLHSFLRQQPDVNWRNPEVRSAMYEAMRFWLRRGVDGFRVDVIYHFIKDAQFRDNPLNPDFKPGGDPAHRLLPAHTIDQPEVQQIVAEMRRVVEEFSTSDSARILIGEIYLPIDRLVAYYGQDQAGMLHGAQLPFNFHLIGVHWQAGAIDRLVRNYEAALPSGATPNWVLGNHDKSRIASRVGIEAARLAAMLLLTLRGTPTLYYGDELGMSDVPIPADEVQDPFEKNEPGKGLGRDPERTPMPWTAEAPNAGFSAGKPWLRLSEDVRTRNVECQSNDEASMLTLYRRLLALRRQRASLNQGAWEPVAAAGDVLAYTRIDGDERTLIVLNFGEAPAPLPPAVVLDHAQLLLSTALEHKGDWQPGDHLLPDEGVIFGQSHGHLEKLLQGMTSTNLHAEIDFNKAQGKEV